MAEAESKLEKLQHHDIMPFAIAKPGCLAFEKQTIDELAKYLKPANPGEEVDCRDVSPSNLCSQRAKTHQITTLFDHHFPSISSPFTLITDLRHHFPLPTGAAWI